MTRPRSFALATSTCLAAAALMAGPSGLGLSLSLLAMPALAQTAEELEKQYGREAMWQALETKRRYDLYGIHFDLDKATIQPQAESLLNDIAETMATFHLAAADHRPYRLDRRRGTQRAVVAGAGRRGEGGIDRARRGFGADRG
jgi:hypothetical protein